MEINIQHDQSTQRFFTMLDGKIAYLDYAVSVEGKTLDYHHTFTPTELRGQGIAEQIVRFALDYAKDNHFEVIPSCSYVKKFIELHPEYRYIVTKI